MRMNKKEWTMIEEKDGVWERMSSNEEERRANPRNLE